MSAKTSPTPRVPPFHGLLLINKDPGGTSHDVVGRVRRLLGTREVGHAGTLDPMAGGLMVLLIGEGTKLSNYLLEGDKAYRAGVKLGLETDTLDITGTVVKEQAPVRDPERIRKAIESLEGEFHWEVPLYSAAKVQGKRLHEYAREGRAVERPTKAMRFWELRWAGELGAEFEIELSCSKGSFVRSWIHQLGQVLGCGAVMSSLVRTRSTPYELGAAVTLEELEAFLASEAEARPSAGRPAEARPAEARSGMIPLSQALPWAKRVRIRGQDQKLLMNGQISHDLRSRLITQFRPGQDRLIQIQSEEGALLALVGIEPERGFVIRRVFNDR